MSACAKMHLCFVLVGPTIRRAIIYQCASAAQLLRKAMALVLQDDNEAGVFRFHANEWHCKRIDFHVAIFF